MINKKDKLTLRSGTHRMCDPGRNDSFLIFLPFRLLQRLRSNKQALIGWIVYSWKDKPQSRGGGVTFSLKAERTLFSRSDFDACGIRSVV